MLGGTYASNFLELHGFYMPLLVKPKIPATTSRESFAPANLDFTTLKFLNNDGELLSKKDELVEQWALQAKFLLGDFELSTSWVHHFDRTDVKIIPQSLTELTPVLTQVDHFGLGMNYILGSWIFKTELVYRDFKDNISNSSTNLKQVDYGIAAVALEYGFSSDNGSESTIIIELQELIDVDKPDRFTLTPFQRDLFLGYRHAFNDELGKELFFFTIFDLERRLEMMLNLSYSQRLSDTWKIKSGLRVIKASPDNTFDLSGIRQLDKDHQLYLDLSYYF